MTIIVAIEHEGAVYVGCDSAITAADRVDASKEPKWWKRGEVLVAYAGDLRAATVARDAHARQRHPREDVEAYVDRLAKRTRAALRNARINPTELDLLVVLRGRAYVVGDGVKTRSAHGYAAIGSGADLALGSLASTEYSPPEDRVWLALEATARHSSSCAQPFHTDVLRPA